MKLMIKIAILLLVGMFVYRGLSNVGHSVARTYSWMLPSHPLF